MGLSVRAILSSVGTRFSRLGGAAIVPCFPSRFEGTSVLTENDVIQAVAASLQQRGFRIERAASTSDRGPDIEAEHAASGRRLLVEAKGGTSSKDHTRRFGLAFTPGQALSHVSRAFYHAAKLKQLGTGRGDRVALAFPDDPVHRRLIDGIRVALDTLGIAVFFVDAERRVTVQGDLLGGANGG